MNLSPHFTLAELTISQYAARNGVDNTPPEPIIANLQRLCADYLEPLRRAVNGPVVVSSGYRSPKVNKAVGGSGGSAHMYGLAADLIVPGMSVRKVCQQIVTLRLPFDQLIDEFGAWVHIAIAPKDSRPRGHKMEARRSQSGGVIYTPTSFL